MAKVSVDEMGNAIYKEFEKYIDMTTMEVDNTVKKVADDVKQEIMREAPVETGAYRKSWEVSPGEKTKNGSSYIVHSKDRYQLTHLLEFGHAKRGGGRTRAFPHISKGEKLAIKELKKLGD